MSAPTHSTVLSRGRVIDELHRILHSDGFRHSERMSRLLRFLVEHALDHPDKPLKEYLIALQVFDKPESFDPRTDPIVRVEASRLRAKLRDYYRDEGAGNTLAIQLPKRGYMPQFSSNVPPTDSTGASVAGEHRDAAEQAAAPDTGPSLVVLPFVDMSSGHTEEYFCDGLTEELINALAQVEGLRVVPRTSAFRFKGAAADIREIGAQLRVNAVLEGSVRRVGDTIRISVQLADVATGYHLWAETFERPLRGILALQDEITRAVVDSLKIKLAVREGQAPPRDAEDPEAYELYLRGLHAWNRRTEQSFHQAIRFLEQALRRNPGHARSWATLASCQIGLLLSSAVDPRRVIPEAREAAAKALALAPGLADALAARALIHAVYDHNWKASEADFDLALRHAPHHPTIREWYALTCLVPAGRLDQAIAQLHTAVDLDPISVILHSQLGFALYLQRRFEDAVRQLRLALELDPAFYRAYWDLGMAYIQLERFDEALEVLEQARQTDPSNPFRWGALGYAYARAGREAQAHAVLEQLQRLSANRYVSSTCIAEIQVALGSHAAAMDTLTSAVEQHAHRLIWIGADPIYDPLRQEIGFRALCTAIGLAS